jgi:hypothetical protein
MTPEEHPLDDAEWHDLDPPIATLWGIVTACFGLAFVAFAEPSFLDVFAPPQKR